MSGTAKKTVGQPDTGVPPIEDLLPEMVRIAELGDVVERIVRFLIAQGYNKTDAWRELKKLQLSDAHGSAILNTFTDIYTFGRAHSYANPLDNLRRSLRVHRAEVKGKAKGKVNK